MSKKSPHHSYYTSLQSSNNLPPPFTITTMNSRAHTNSLLLVVLLELFFFSNAFSFGGRAFVQRIAPSSNDNSHCQSRLHSSIPLDDEMRVPSGAYGITTPPQAVNARAAAAEFSLQTSSLIPICGKPLSQSPAESIISYNKDLDLPRRSRTSDTDLYETLTAVELSVSRIAMIAALGLFSVEITTGKSVLDQILRMLG